MKNVLKFMVIMMAMVVVSVMSTQNDVFADSTTTNKGVPIDKEHFPDDLIREHVENWFDRQGDGYLSEEEINAVTAFGIDAYGYQEDEEDKEPYKSMSEDEKYQRYCVLDCTGLEIFTNVTKVRIALGGGMGRYSKLKNLTILSKLSKLEELEIENEGCIKNYDLTKFHTLKTLKLTDCKRIKQVKFWKKSKIEKITMDDSVGKIDVSSLKYLKSFKAEDTGLSKVTFGKKNKRLEKIYIKYIPKEGNNKLKTIDVSKLKNLKKLEIDGLKKLKSIKFGKNKKLEVVTIDSCDQLKKVDISKPKNIKKLYIRFMKNLKKIKLGKKTKLKELVINECFKVKTVNVTGMNTPKKAKVYIDKGIQQKWEND